MFYQGVVASQLLYGSETWVLPPSGLRALEGFHVEAARRLTGMRPKKVNGVWEYPHSADVLEAAGLRTIADTIAKRRSNIAKTIEGRQILKESREAERRRGSPLPHHVVGPRARFHRGGSRRWRARVRNEPR